MLTRLDSVLELHADVKERKLDVPVGSCACSEETGCRLLLLGLVQVELLNACFM